MVGRVFAFSSFTRRFFSPTPLSTQARAQAYLDAVRASPDGWRGCLARAAEPEAPPEARFWCLQTLHEV